MNTDVYTISELQERLAPVFEEYQVKKAILFGSYAKGKARPQSDVDLLVDSGLRGLQFLGLQEALRMALDDKEVELFDVTHLETASPVDREIVKTGIQIWPL